ncbi:cell envelope integrity protein CreD [Shewanella eurypsychrophilus]|uniref:Cell envelope integrity protein CreD n=1 Tax=Shewanella eurypsychrophilus TaxID=2593656 RepID=A0ABX6V194_9GAMM|nr:MULTISPECIES: cell envelope integrity protein CreD [Shewanella]QFU21101.1 cell envelope integrity protein CreD [Shewanella sp. YLB-09]QPG56390.1 cell envelope integrity protein CreD [Shewanella eurypsychrophilus]
MFDLFTSAKTNLTHKILIVAGLSLLSLIPLGLVMDMAWEREALYHDVVAEIGQSWGDKQEISGPALVVPYTYQVIQEAVSDEGKVRKFTSTYQNELVILPKLLELNIELKHDFRSRGIFQSLVYNAQLNGTANFELTQINIPNLIKLNLENARMVFGISANQAIDKINNFELRDEQSKVITTQSSIMSGTGLANQIGLERGFHQPVGLNPKQTTISLGFDLMLRGSQSISALPLGEQTHIKISADWPHPSFNGLLPADRTISEQGFKANWNISHLSRNFPQVFSKDQQINLREINANTILFEPVTHYGKIERSVKYGLLFIVLSFIILLIFELSQNSKLSLIQYLLVGTAMTLFYLLLLSLSEHLAFSLAYIIAASVPVLSVSAYVASATASLKRGGIMLAMLIGLYGVLYSILKLEDYALLMGTGLLVVIMLVLMFITRRSGINESESTMTD